MSLPHLIRLHLVFAIWTMIWIVGLIGLTLGVELTGDAATIADAKRVALYAIVLLAPVMIALEQSGKRLAANSHEPFVRRKQRRLFALKVNGVCILIPSAIVLDRLSHAGQINTLFYAVKALLVLAASMNLILLALNFRDGLRQRIAKQQILQLRA